MDDEKSYGFWLNNDDVSNGSVSGEKRTPNGDRGSSGIERAEASKAFWDMINGLGMTLDKKEDGAEVGDTHHEMQDEQHPDLSPEMDNREISEAEAKDSEPADGEELVEQEPDADREEKPALPMMVAEPPGADDERTQPDSRDPYCFPETELLDPVSDTRGGDGIDYENAIQVVFMAKGIDATLIGKARGAKSDRYEFKVAPGTRLITVKHTNRDIAFEVGAEDVTIDRVIGKPGVVAIDIPRATQESPVIRKAFEGRAFSESRESDTVAIGEDAQGEAVLSSLSELKNLIVVGTSGSGKSVFLNVLITSLLYKATPEELRLVLVDPGMVELAPFNGVGHLSLPVVTNTTKAGMTLMWAEFETMKRLKLFSENGVRGFQQYNELAAKDQRLNKLPQVVVVVDGLESSIVENPDQCVSALSNVCRLGTTAGVHLVVSMDNPVRPIVEKFQSRVAFLVTSAAQSRIVIGAEGAEKLSGKGDMLYLPMGARKAVRLQGYYISPREIDAVCQFVRRYGVEYDSAIMRETFDKGETDVAEDDEDVLDALLPAAIDIIFEIGQASTSMLQRKLKLEYSRASKLTDRMEELGIIGPFTGSKPREILMSKQQWIEMKSRWGEESLGM